MNPGVCRSDAEPDSFSDLLISDTDGGPTRIGVNSVDLVPVPPLSATADFLSAYNDPARRAPVALMTTLPFGMMALAELRRSDILEILSPRCRYQARVGRRAGRDLDERQLTEDPRNSPTGRDTPNESALLSPVDADAVPLRYGQTYEFRVCLADLTGGGPATSDAPVNPAVAGIGRCDFRRFVPPKTAKIDEPTISPDGRRVAYPINNGAEYATLFRSTPVHGQVSGLVYGPVCELFHITPQVRQFERQTADFTRITSENATTEALRAVLR